MKIFDPTNNPHRNIGEESPENCSVMLDTCRESVPSGLLTETSRSPHSGNIEVLQEPRMSPSQASVSPVDQSSDRREERVFV